MNEFESSTEPTDIASKFDDAVKVGRGMTRPSCIFPWVDPMTSFISALTPEEINPTPSYKLRRKEEYIRHVKITIKVKKGPGKGRYRSYWNQLSTKYMAYYGIRN